MSHILTTMNINKITHGFVTQTFEDGKFLDQTFTAGDIVEYEDDYGNALDEGEANIPYISFDMFSLEEKEAAETIAQHILDTEEDDYKEHKENGFDPSVHVFYHALILIGAGDEALQDYEDYKEQQRRDEKNGLYGGQEDIAN